MKIKWFGHACFLLTSSDDTKIVTDPFDESLGYKLPQTSADVVTVNHEHFDHSYTKAVSGNFVCLKEAGVYREKNIPILGVETFHDTQHGKQRGKNIVFKFTIDDLDICHLGDLGHVLDEQQPQLIGNVDILLIPIGGTYTLDASSAKIVISQIKPVVAIPMHYKTSALSFPLADVDSFLALFNSYNKLEAVEIEINKNNINQLPQIIVMQYS